MDHLLLASTLFLVLHALMGMVDGLYLHLWRDRLHARPESRREHAWHTARAVLFPLMVGLLYLRPTGGLLLWAGIAVMLLDLLMLLVDVLEEPGSRASMGGLPGREYALHVLLTATHIASVSLLLAARPVAAFSLDAPLVASEVWPSLVSVVAVNLLPGSVLVAAVHLFLLAQPGRLPVRS